MSRDPIRNELRGLDSWITREEWIDWENEPRSLEHSIREDALGFAVFDSVSGKRLSLYSPTMGGAILSRNALEEKRLDPRDPDHSRSGIFVYHNCSRCNNGDKPCVEGGHNICSYPRARND